MMDIDIKVNSVEKVYEKSATLPIFCMLSNNCEAIVKYKNNNEGNLTLINEYISYQIASIIGLNIPKYGLCILDSSCVNNIKTEFTLTEQNYGVSFFSVLVPKIIPMNAAIVPRIKNIKEFFKMLLFDHIVYNKDRHGGNILISSELIFYAIDHSHVFKNEAVWDKHTFIKGIELEDINDVNILESNRGVYSVFFNNLSTDIEMLLCLAKDIKQRLTPSEVNNIILSIPEDWVSANCKKDLVFLEAYINYRVLNINQICKIIVDGREQK